PPLGVEGRTPPSPRRLARTETRAMIFETLAAMALRELLGAGGDQVGLSGLDLESERLEKVVRFFSRRFRDHGERLPRALARSHERAWKALEIALAGEGMWGWLANKEDKAFRQRVRAFLDAAPCGELAAQGPEFRKACLKELRYARADGL